MEQNYNIEKAAAMALLDRGVGFSIPAPFFYRLFGRKKMKIAVKRLRLGTLVHLSTVIDLSPLETLKVSEAHDTVIKNMESVPASLPIKTILENINPVSLCVAACLLNSPLKIWLFAPVLARHLRKACTADQLQELMMWVLIYGRMESFIITTKLIARMTRMGPMNLGQE